MIRTIYNTFCLFLLLSLSFSLSAQVVINEYSASNLNSFQDNFGKTEDWIELYNTSSEAVDLGGWHLSDKETKPEKWEIPAGTMIEGNGFLVFWCSGRNLSVGTKLHTSFKLTQTRGEDYVLLSTPGGAIIESIPLALTLVEHSRCRSVDGGTDWKICTNPSLETSNTGTTQFNAYTQTPTINQEAGYYTDNILVSVTNNEPNSILRYTIDGTNPTETSPEYTAPLLIENTRVVKAQSFSNDPEIHLGKMDFNTYFINEDFTLAVFSVGANDVIDLANGNGDLIPIGSIEYFGVNKEREATSFGSLNRHGQDSWILNHRSIDWISRDEMGYSNVVNAPLFSYSDRDEYQRFMFRNSGDDNYPANDDFNHRGSTHIRDEYVQELAREGGLKLDTRAVERVILFLNGEYWGVYGMRERPVDHDYTKEYYGQDKYNLHYLTTWGSTEAEYGGQDAFDSWFPFRDFILENDMSDSANYAYVKENMQVLSMIDYMIANLNTVAMDWMNYNTGWWRGLNPDGDHKKWGYILWDLDATFDYYINYTGIPNTSPDAEPCDMDVIADSMDDFFGFLATNDGLDVSGCTTIMNGTCPYPEDDPFIQDVFEFQSFCCTTEWGDFCQVIYDFVASGGGGSGVVSYNGNVGAHEKLFLKLQDENEEFRQLYYSRQADLMNTVYSCENMLTTLERMLAVIEPEMPRQIQRWGGSMSEWEDNVNDLRAFISARCTLLDDGMVNCFDVTGPYALTLMTEPDGIGEIDLNTLDIETFPWTGNYFGGMDNKIKAKVFDEYEDDYVFSHWVSNAGNVIFPNEFNRKANITLVQADTLTAVFTVATATQNIIPGLDFNLFPNPAKDRLVLEYELDATMDLEVSLLSVLGESINVFAAASGSKSAGSHTFNLNLKEHQISSGLYMLKIQSGNKTMTRKVSIFK